VSPNRFDTVLGETETIQIEVTNAGAEPTGPLVGHLLVIDPDSNVSADAEDWTDELTRPLASLSPGESTTILWEVQPISTGDFFVMVALAPVDPSELPTITTTMVFSIVGAEASLEKSVVFVAIAVPLLLLAGAWGISRLERLRLSNLSVSLD
jgi:hypothetical protein